MLALSQAATITVSVAALFAFITLVALLRILLRREPAPAGWRRFRLGIFVERDPNEDEREQ